MTITKKTDNELLTMELDGRLDTNTAPALEQEINNSVTSEIKKLVLDFKKLQYISSAGLRVLLAAQKKMNKQGCMIIKNANEMIMDIFHVTGFIDILTVE